MADPTRGRDPRLTRAVAPGMANEADVDEFVRLMLASEQLPMASPRPEAVSGRPMTPATPPQRSNLWADTRKRRQVPPAGAMGL